MGYVQRDVATTYVKCEQVQSLRTKIFGNLLKLKIFIKTIVSSNSKQVKLNSFLLRFSDSMAGGLSVTACMSMNDNENGNYREVWNQEPFSRHKLRECDLITVYILKNIKNILIQVYH